MQVKDFGPFHLSAFEHADPSVGMCVMEMVSFVAGEEWSANPSCASPVVAKFCQVINDCMDQGFRNKLQRYVPRLIGTASPEHDQARAEYLAWRAIKVHTPIALENATLHELAAYFRDFNENEGFLSAYKIIRKIAHGLGFVSGAPGDAADVIYLTAMHAANSALYAFASLRDDSPSSAAQEAARSCVHAKDELAIWETLNGLLKIGPSGEAYTREQMDRLFDLQPKLTKQH